ncbi:MAG: PEP-CTERM sorting domain-containing protein [Terracidiphilus sp.]
MRKSLSIVALLFVGLLGAQSAKADPCNGFAANLIQNCAFGTGDFTGWSGTATADAFNFVDQGDPLAIGSTPYNGLANEAALGSSTDEDLSQTFATTVGQQYTVQFALLNDTTPDIGYINDFTATFGGTTLFSESNAAADGYTLYSFDIDGASTSTTLDFTSENWEGYFELDSVSVAATPEPGSLLLFGTGLLALAGAARRRLCR